MMQQWLSFMTYRRKTLIYFEVFSVFANLLVLVLPIYSLQIFNRVLTSHSLDTLFYLTLIACCLLVLQNFMDYARQRLLNNIKNIYDASFDTQMLSMVSDNLPDGEQVLKSHQQTSQYFCSPFLRARSDLPWAFIFVVVMFFLHPLLGAYALTCCSLLVLLILISSLRTQKLSHRSKTAKGKQASLAAKFVAQGKQICAQGITEKLVRKWEKQNQHVMSEQDRASRQVIAVQSLTKLLRTLVQVGVYALGAILVIQGDILAGTLLASSILMNRVLSPFELASQHFQGYKQQKDAFAYLHQLICNHQTSTKLSIDLSEIAVSFNKVSLESRSRMLLADVSFKLDSGKCLEVRGPSGSGKSMLLALLAREVVPTKGAVSFNSVDIASIAPTKLSDTVGYISQTPSLIRATVAENICGFRELSAVSDDILLACRKANAASLISKLPDNYMTLIENEGDGLSRSEIQKLAIARCLYGMPTLLILDCPSVFLDPISKTHLVNALSEAKQRGTTIVFVSDDPAIQSLADYVIELNDGLLTKGYQSQKRTLKSSDCEKNTALKASGYHSISY